VLFIVDVGDGAKSDCKKVNFSAENCVSVTVRMLQVVDDVQERCKVDVATFSTYHCIYRCVCCVYPARIGVMDINICGRPIDFSNCTMYGDMCRCHILDL
jgi:hypothetical protein